MSLEIEKMNKFIDWLYEKLIFTKVIKNFKVIKGRYQSKSSSVTQHLLLGMSSDTRKKEHDTLRQLRVMLMGLILRIADNLKVW